MKYLIDGYNVIHQMAQLRTKRLRSQREEFIRFLETAQMTNRRFKDLTVIFDGQSDVSAPRMHSAIKITFSRGGCADKKIKEIVESSNFARDIAVVSDDREVRSYIGSLGAKKVSVKEFLKTVCSSFGRRDVFKLDETEAKKINRELERVWLERKDK